MIVADLIKQLQALPQDLEVVLPHWWEIDDTRCWPITPEAIEVVRAERGEGECFQPSESPSAASVVLLG